MRAIKRAAKLPPPTSVSQPVQPVQPVRGTLKTAGVEAVSSTPPPVDTDMDTDMDIGGAVPLSTPPPVTSSPLAQKVEPAVPPSTPPSVDTDMDIGGAAPPPVTPLSSPLAQERVHQDNILLMTDGYKFSHYKQYPVSWVPSDALRVDTHTRISRASFRCLGPRRFQHPNTRRSHLGLVWMTT